MRTTYSMAMPYTGASFGRLLNTLFPKQSFVTLVFLFILSVPMCVSAQNVTIFQPTDAPPAGHFNDGQGISLGVKFQSTQNGYITGIRYYKPDGIGGIHTGQLWNSAGTLLAQVVFNGETASGWQQALFQSPVAITANTTYIASYHNTSGDYAASNNYFTQAIGNGPLRALASGEDGLNGLYGYAATPVFPANGSNAGNYWVDVIFNTTITADVTPPVVTTTFPANAATGVPTYSSVSVSFTEWIDPATVTATSFQLRDASNAIVPATVAVSANQATLTPSTAFANSAVYTATVKGGASGVKDLAGNPLSNDHTWSFTIAPIPAPDGPGGPILVLSSIANPFSRYTTEILKAEGLNEYTAKDISQTNAADLANYDVVILGEMNINASQAAMFTNWVNAGGTFIAFRPSVELSSLLGITKIDGTVPDQYIQINTASGPGAGIVGETIQFHGVSDIYNLNGASSLATLFLNATTALPYPAITSRAVGSNGGKAIAFTYDLPRSIVYTRQGNPAWAGQKRDGTTGPIRSDDMFFGTNTPDYVDFNKIVIPQADEQQRLLVNIILQSNLHRKPLPRFWFLPSDHKAVVVMTGDDHSFNGTTGQFNYFKTQGPNTPQDVADWKAIRGTSYIYNGTLDNPHAVAFDADGFEIALHVNTNCSDVTAAQFQDDITSQMSLFKSVLPSLPPCVTNRNHCVTWSDWASVAKVQAQNGIRLDVNYYYWPAAWVQNRPGLFTGSGAPMRFADSDGSIIDCYQVATQMSDEAAIDYTYFANALLDKAQGPEGYYGVFCANMHTDSAVHSGANAIIASAIAHNVPVIAARQMLTWLDARNGSSFDDMSWNNGQLSFTITALTGANNMRAMVPVQSANGQLTSMSKDGAPLAFTIQTIKGMQYAFFSVSVGASQYVANYNTGPVVTTHPVSLAVCANEMVGFKSNATGSPAPTAQWQVSTDNGGTWTNISGATSGSYSFVATAADNNKQYRTAWTNSQGSSFTNAAILTTHAKPVLSSNLAATAASGSVFNYTPVSATAGTEFTWSRAAATGISNPAANGTGAISETLINTTNAAASVIYNYELTADGCSNAQNVTVTVSPVPVQQDCSVGTSQTAGFNSTAIKAGRYIWFNSIFDPSSLGNGPVNFNVRNSKITYKVNNQLVTLNVPDAHIRFDASVVIPNTSFVNGVWETVVPLSYNGNVFMTGLSYLVPLNLPGNINNVKWTADVSSDKTGVSLNWKWAAAVYTNFASNAGLSIKTTDGPIELLGVNITDKAATPLNYKLFVISGGTGGGILSLGIISVGLLNYTGSYSSAVAVTVNCTGRTQVTGKSAAMETGTKESIVQEGLFDAKAMPNPSASYFDLLITGRYDNSISVRVADINGRMIEQYPKVSAGTVLRIGEKWRGGTYIVELIQGDQRKIVKLIKLN